jgi:flagellar protein FlgJ
MGAQILSQNPAVYGMGQSGTPDGDTSHKAKKAWAAAQSFESVFIKNLYNQAFAGVTGEGPLGTKGTGADTWRDLLIDEYAKSTTKSGGIGISKDVYSQLMRLQESH